MTLKRPILARVIPVAVGHTAGSVVRGVTDGRGVVGSLCPFRGGDIGGRMGAGARHLLDGQVRSKNDQRVAESILPFGRYFPSSWIGKMTFNNVDLQV